MIGTIISHYKVLSKLGEGGMSVVYKAHDTKLDRDVALKFLPPHLDASDEDIARFQQEARAISALNHPHIETIYDVDEIDDQKFLVLEYVPGGTLKSKLKQLKSDDKAFSINEVLDYGTQLAEALAHAHRHQIIHRDVKTDNILLTEEGKSSSQISDWPSCGAPFIKPRLVVPWGRLPTCHRSRSGERRWISERICSRWEWSCMSCSPLTCPLQGNMMQQ
jgi:serine/threonine protein kinase